MKKSLIILAAALTSSTALAAHQVGEIDGVDAVPADGGDEFDSSLGYTDTFVYDYSADADPVSAPTMPRYLTPVASKCTAARGSCARQVDIDFSLDHSRVGAELTYGMYGEDSDNIYIDGVLVDTVTGPGIGDGDVFVISLGALAAGDHTITIEFDGSTGGHWIDFLSLELIN